MLRLRLRFRLWGILLARVRFARMLQSGSALWLPVGPLWFWLLGRVRLFGIAVRIRPVRGRSLLLPLWFVWPVLRPGVWRRLRRAVWTRLRATLFDILWIALRRQPLRLLTARVCSLWLCSVQLRSVRLCTLRGRLLRWPDMWASMRAGVRPLRRRDVRSRRLRELCSRRRKYAGSLWTGLRPELWIGVLSDAHL
jgi:hypothetical protein